MNPVDRFLNQTTMYRVVLYGLVFLVAWAIGVSATGRLAFGPVQAAASLVLLVVSCLAFNALFARLYRVTVNVESWLITALILFFLFLPAGNLVQGGYLWLASLIAIGGKFVLAIRRDHWVNPAALAAAVLGFWPQTSAGWWVASEYLWLPTAAVGLLVVRKIRRASLFAVFALTALAVGIARGVEAGQILVSWPLLFLGTIMLTEPITMPRVRKWQYVYAAAVGGLFGSQLSLGPIRVTPELALVAGNLLAGWVSDKQKYLLRLVNKVEENESTYTFEFEADKPVRFRPGQYGEWTLSLQGRPDARGNRRFFTIASAPGTKKVELGVKIFKNCSQFKKSLSNMQPGQSLVLSGVGGDFVLDDLGAKYVFMAGGIGVTPFRSIALDLLSKGMVIDAVMFYFNKPGEKIAYREIFDDLFKDGPGKIIYREQRISAQELRETVEDWERRRYYLSGPALMVQSYKSLLMSLGVSRWRIITDYFPGF